MPPDASYASRTSTSTSGRPGRRGCALAYSYELFEIRKKVRTHRRETPLSRLSLSPNSAFRLFERLPGPRAFGSPISSFSTLTWSLSSATSASLPSLPFPSPTARPLPSPARPGRPVLGSSLPSRAARSHDEIAVLLAIPSLALMARVGTPAGRSLSASAFTLGS